MPFFVLELEKLIQRLEEEFNIRLGSEKNLVFSKHLCLITQIQLSLALGPS